MTTKSDLLKRLSVRTLEYVGMTPAKHMECDIEMRDLAVEALVSMGLEPAAELRRHLREKRWPSGSQAAIASVPTRE